MSPRVEKKANTSLSLLLQIFDPSLMKKKKKKKTAFDLDGAMAAEADEQQETGATAAGGSEPLGDDVEDDLDLEDFGKKKKKKKKKAFNEAELEVQPSAEGPLDDEEQNDAAAAVEDDLDIDFASSKKKKRTKKKDLNEILELDDAKDEDKENGKLRFDFEKKKKKSPSESSLHYMLNRFRGCGGRDRFVFSFLGLLIAKY